MAAEEEKPKQEVQVRRVLVKVKPGLEEEKDVYRVTYWSRDIPPRTLWIDKEKWSPEAERKAIQADMKAREKEKPETVTL
ncbi:MAG: hypothetical protein ACE5OO_00365 [Candidatus Bathyarchaeia archaeon]